MPVARNRPLCPREPDTCHQDTPTSIAIYPLTLSHECCYGGINSFAGASLGGFGKMLLKGMSSTHTSVTMMKEKPNVFVNLGRETNNG